MTDQRRTDPSVGSSLSEKLIHRVPRRVGLTWMAVLVLLFVGVPAAQAHQFTPGYLEECKRNGELPEQRRLIQIFLPWYR